MHLTAVNGGKAMLSEVLWVLGIKKILLCLIDRSGLVTKCVDDSLYWLDQYEKVTCDALIVATTSKMENA